MIALLFIAGGCNSSSVKSRQDSVVIAVVNGEEVLGDNFLKEYSDIKNRLKIADPANIDLENQLRDRVLNSIINSLLLFEEVKKAGIEVPKEVWEKEAVKMLEGFSPARLQVTLEESGLTLGQWKEGVRDNFLVEKLIQTKIAPYINVPEKEIKEYYKKHPDEFKIPARVHTYHIVVSTLSEADELRNELLYGADFEELAHKYSNGPEATRGGDLGVFAKRRMPKEFDDVIFKLRTNDISKVVESPYGYHIFKVAKKFKPTGMKYADAREKIFNRMFQERLERKFEEWFKKIKDNAHIAIYTDLLYQL